jgi:uncharacterized protein with HEPN domain
MDEELKHILHVIDDMIESISRTMGYINKLDYTKFGIYHELEHWLYQVYKLNSYTRSLDHKLNEFNSNNENDEYDLYIRKYGPESDIDSYDTVTHNRDNGDME